MSNLSEKLQPCSEDPAVKTAAARIAKIHARRVELQTKREKLLAQLAETQPADHGALADAVLEGSVVLASVQSEVRAREVEVRNSISVLDRALKDAQRGMDDAEDAASVRICSHVKDERLRLAAETLKAWDALVAATDSEREFMAGIERLGYSASRMPPPAFSQVVRWKGERDERRISVVEAMESFGKLK